MTRQLTAIMFADMVGYTALMQEDEGRAKVLRDRQREILEKRVVEFEGEVLQYYGDGALCGFQSAIQAVECAVAIQVDLREDPPVPVRIGLHLGDVVIEESGVYGDGVNIASRIQALAAAGGVLVSGKIADEVRNQPGISAQFLAEVPLKNVRDPQRVFAITNADLAVPTVKDLRDRAVAGGAGRGRKPGVVAGWIAGLIALGALAFFGLSGLFGPESSPVMVPIQETIAILPFHYEGHEPDQDQAEGLATLLGGVLGGGVFVPVDQQSVQGLVAALDQEGISGQRLYQRVASEVGSDLVLHGNLVSQRGGLFSAHAYLFDSRTSEDVANEFEQHTDLFELAVELASKILLSRSDADPALKTDLPTESLDALKAFTQADREFQAGNYPQAKGLFQEAVEADSGFAIAHYRLSQAALWAWDFDTARDAGEEAWELGSKLSSQNQALLAAWRNFLSSEPVLAERGYRDILDSSPQNVEALAGLGSVLVYFNSLRGRLSEEALPYFRRALEANPKYGEVRYHVLEAEAKLGDREAFDRWFEGLNSESEQYYAFRAVRAFRWGDQALQARFKERLDAATDEELVYAIGRVAASVHDFPGARTLGALLLSPQRQQELRWGAHGFFASLAFASGRWTEARRELELTARGEEEWSLEMRTLFSLFLFDFIPSSEEELSLLRDSLEVWTPEEFIPFSRPRELFGPHSLHHEEFKLYLLGLLSSRLGDPGTAMEYVRELRLYGRAPDTRDLTHYLSQSVEAHLRHAQGDSEAALRIVEATDYFPNFEFIFTSPIFSQALDRWLLADLLRESGDLQGALDWFATLSDGWGEFLFAAPAHLKQAQIYEELGNRDEAIAHYQRFEDLWAEADPELRVLVEEARAARERLAAEGGI